MSTPRMTVPPLPRGSAEKPLVFRIARLSDADAEVAELPKEVNL